MRILVAPDKFKASLTAVEAAEAIRTGFLEVFPEAKIRCVALADGGEGTVAAMLEAIGGEWVETDAHDALGRPIRARYGWQEECRLAMLEMAEADGLWRIAPHERSPLESSTRGTGEIIADAIRRGAQRILVGLGGSATTDAGAGAAAALGVRFLAANGTPVHPVPARLRSIARIVPSALEFPEIVALSDVDNPLLGPRGCAHVFGPQKGVSDPAALDGELHAFADLVTRELGRDSREVSGAGAAGGLGYGLLTFCGAEIRPGFEEISALLDLPRLVTECDLVVTAEGSLDPQTLAGKGPAGIARLARAAGKPVIALAGGIREEHRLHEVFDACLPIADRPMTLEESMGEAGDLLVRAAARAARLVALRL